MREKIILSKTHIKKSELLNTIKNLGKKYNFRIEKDDLYEMNDTDFYRDISEEQFYLIGFQLVIKEKFGRDLFNVDGENYANLIFITHNLKVLNEVNILIKELLGIYPELRVTDETYKNYFSIEDINSGNVDPWLLD